MNNNYIGLDSKERGVIFGSNSYRGEQPRNPFLSPDPVRYGKMSEEEAAVLFEARYYKINLGSLNVKSLIRKKELFNDLLKSTDKKNPKSLPNSMIPFSLTITAK